MTLSGAGASQTGIPEVQTNLPQIAFPSAKPALQTASPTAQKATQTDHPTVQSAPQAAQPRLTVFETYANSSIDPELLNGLRLTQFGYNVFSPPSKFDPSNLMPIGPEYLLGPGDELKINIWGKVNTDVAVVIDRDGKVNLGEFGTLHLAGLKFSEAKNYLLQELARYYKPSEVRMNVSLGALSSMRVFVVGKAADPGSYSVSSMSTVLNALIAAGGPSKAGSLRDIRVNRNGQTVASFDAYDLLLRGDKKNDIRLRPDDVIFIPPVGQLVAVAGFVKAPGIYELKGESTVKEVLEMAGGISELAFSGRLKIDRISDGKRISLEASDGPEAVSEVKPGDLITVFDAVPEKTVVRLAGAVGREGEYGVSEGLTVNGLLKLAGGLRPFANDREAELTRVKPTPAGPETTKFIIDLQKALAGDPVHDIELQPYDYLFIRLVPEWQLYRTVSIKGEIRFPGTYTIEKGETIHSLIKRAGGFTDKAYLKGAFFSRVSVKAQQQKRINEFADRLEYELISITAESVERSLNPLAAEQLRVAAEQKKALIEKIRGARATGRIAIDLEPFDSFRGSHDDITLEEGDELVVPEKPAQVQVIGSVYNQTSFVFSPDTTISGYLSKAGGFTRNADEDEMYILKVDGTAVSKRNSSGWSMAWDSAGGGWVSGFSAKKLDPGDTIVVPEEVEQVVWLREFKDITQILYQIAVTAGVLIVAF